MSSVERDPEELVDCLGEKYSYTILRSTVDEPKLASEIIEEEDVPRTTFYRRVDRLAELGLIEEHGTVDLSGSHSTRYECNVELIQLEAEQDGFSATLRLTVAPVDRWTRAWQGIQDESE